MLKKNTRGAVVPPAAKMVTGLMILLVLSFLQSCTPAGRRGTVRVGMVQTGLASYYGEKYHGRRTASGEIFDMYKLSAAHRSLPLGTRVRVRNLANGRTLVLRINDRGPFVRGRILDCSWEAARQLGFLQQG
jgi:rare lipoprotein A